MGEISLRSIKDIIPKPIKDYIVRYRRRDRSGRTINHRYLGLEFELHVVDALSNEWYGRDWLPEERQEFFFLSKLGISPSGLVFDLGAHQGLVALLLKRKLVPQGRVVAIELDRLNAETCERNFKLNRESEIFTMHAGISDRRGMVKTTGRSNASIAGNRSVFRFLNSNVNSTTIDDLVTKFGVPDLIYLDIEGAEVLALRGAREAINCVANWFIELHSDESCAQFGGSNLEIARKFVDSGYRVHISEAEGTPFVQLVGLAQLPSGRCFLIASREPAR